MEDNVPVVVPVEWLAEVDKVVVELMSAMMDYFVSLKVTWPWLQAEDVQNVLIYVINWSEFQAADR